MCLDLKVRVRMSYGSLRRAFFEKKHELGSQSSCSNAIWITETNIIKKDNLRPIGTMARFHLKLIKVDFKPEPKISDLNLGAAYNYLGTRKSVIRYKNFTVKFTRNLTFQVFIKKAFIQTLRELPREIGRLARTLNVFKTERVRSYPKVSVNNILLQTYATDISFDDIKVNYPHAKWFVGVGSEPTIPYSGDLKNINYAKLDIQLNQHTNSKVRFYKNKRVSVIITRLDDFQEYMDFSKSVCGTTLRQEKCN